MLFAGFVSLDIQLQVSIRTEFRNMSEATEKISMYEKGMTIRQKNFLMPCVLIWKKDFHKNRKKTNPASAWVRLYKVY